VSFALHFALVLVLVALQDAAWAFYIKQSAACHPFRAAIASSAIFAMGGLVTVSYVDDHRYIAAAIAGGFLGTYLAVRRGKASDDPAA
jgi:hypothetical protein